MHIPYLQQSRSGIFYFRIVIPKPMRATLGCNELRRSLRTRDLAQAILRMRRYLDEVPYALQERQLMFDFDKLKKATAYSQFKVKVTRDQNNTLTVEGEADATVPGDVEGLQDTLRLIQQGDTVTASTPPVSTNTAVPAKPLTPPPAVAANVSAPSPVTGLITDHLEEYYAFKLAGKEWTEQTTYENAPKYALLVDIVGDIPIAEVTKSKAKYVRSILRQTPNNMKKRFGNDVNVHEAIQLTKQLPADQKKLISSATINKHLQAYNNFFTYLEDEKELIESSPFHGITVNNPKSVNVLVRCPLLMVRVPRLQCWPVPAAR